MVQYRYRLVIIVVALIILVTNAELWPLRGTPVAYAIPCGLDCENINNSPSISLTLNGTDQTATYTLAMSVNNTLNLGWNVTITSTQFATGSTPTYTLSTAASSTTGVAAVCTSGQTCTTMPQNTVTYPVAVPAGNLAPTAIKFYNAQATSGIGTFDLSTTINVTVPANTYAGTYTSTITVAYASGP
ncbi:MAG: hypothetical protein NVSMB27_13290 [Ktedonobacteraceae bacterium]